mgnify:CR=1 FL=1|tara:strand:+ start:799 stop:1143 length:345 start_codon:yes stop_codon:yes gene_type:complete
MLESLSLKELRKIVQVFNMEVSIQNYSKLKKQELITVLKKHLVVEKNIIKHIASGKTFAEVDFDRDKKPAKVAKVAKPAKVAKAKLSEKAYSKDKASIEKKMNIDKRLARMKKD